MPRPIRRVDASKTRELTWRTRLASARARGERQQCQMARALDGDGQRSLVPGTGAELASRFDLAPLRQMAAEVPEVLVVHHVDVVGAKRANLAARRVAAATAGTPAAPPLAALAAVPSERRTSALGARAES